MPRMTDSTGCDEYDALLLYCILCVCQLNDNGGDLMFESVHSTEFTVIPGIMT